DVALSELITIASNRSLTEYLMFCLKPIPEKSLSAEISYTKSLTSVSVSQSISPLEIFSKIIYSVIIFVILAGGKASFSFLANKTFPVSKSTIIADSAFVLKLLAKATFVGITSENKMMVTKNMYMFLTNFCTIRYLQFYS